MTSRWAVIPIKHAAKSKQRLSKILRPVERQQLTLVMLRDVLDIVCKSHSLNGVLVATRSPQVGQIAQRCGAEVYTESADADHSVAVSQACMHLYAAKQANTVMVIPGDIPCITPEDIEVLLSKHDRITLIPDSRGEGTNGIIASPPNALQFQFGKKSLGRHSVSASESGILAQIIVNKNMSLDIDYPEDLARVIAELPADGSGTRQFLEDSGISGRLAKTQYLKSTNIH